MKWHIIGSHGYIAERLIQSLPPSASIVKYARKENCDKYLELTLRDQNVFDEIQLGDYVIFLAAISSPDICEQNYEYAYSINVEGTKWFIRECIRRQANVLFFSSDIVYGFANDVFDERSITHPISKYGWMKCEVEKAFGQEPQFKVFRLSYVFSAQDKFITYINNCYHHKVSANVFDALYRNVIYIDDVVQAIIQLGEQFQQYSPGIVNLSGPDLLSRKDIASIYKWYRPVFQYTISSPSTEFFMARPNIIKTNSLYLDKLLGRQPQTIKQAMQNELHRMERTS